VSCLRVRVRSRSARIAIGGTKLVRAIPCARGRDGGSTRRRRCQGRRAWRHAGWRPPHRPAARRVLGRLKLGAAGRQEHQADPLGDGQTLRPVPAGVIEHQDDVVRVPRPGLLGEGGERASKKGLERPVERCQTVPPLLGRTKAITCGHRWRWWPGAIAHWPAGARSRRRIGLGPRRCSSSARTSTDQSGCAALARPTASAKLSRALPAPPESPRACRGRGACSDQPIRRRASQPCCGNQPASALQAAGRRCKPGMYRRSRRG
jgi:hypothetical protein